MRFLQALNRTPARECVVPIDADTMSHAQRQRITAVPTLVLDNGAILVGSKAFQWLKQFEGGMELDCFCNGKGLAFSDVNDAMAPASFSSSFSAFQPVP